MQEKFQQVVLVILIFVGYVPAATGQSDPCDQFNFWLGEWEIEQQIMNKDGSWLSFQAYTEVKPILNGRALVENWTGQVKFFWMEMEEAVLLKGYSLRYYDPVQDQWLIYWMDSLNPGLTDPFTGRFTQEGFGEFFKTTVTAGGINYSRITFRQQNPDRVLWKLDISPDQEKWSTLWRMDMRRK